MRFHIEPKFSKGNVTSKNRLGGRNRKTKTNNLSQTEVCRIKSVLVSALGWNKREREERVLFLISYSYSLPTHEYRTQIYTKYMG